MLMVPSLAARVAVIVDSQRRARRRAHLNVMFNPAEVVSDIPIIGLHLALHIFAALDVLTVDGLIAASDVGANGRAGDSAARGRYVSSASTADLVTQYATDDGTGDRSGDVHPATFFIGLARFNPASLLGRPDHHMYRRHRDLVQSFSRRRSVTRWGRGLVIRRSGQYRSPWFSPMLKG